MVFRRLCDKVERFLWRTRLDISVRTTDKLAEVWPEGAALYSSPPLPKVAAGLPAAQLVELNKMLGIVA